MLDGVERALDAEHLNATVLLIGETDAGYEVLLRDGPLSAPMGSEQAPRIARHLGTALRPRSRTGRFLLLSTGFLPPRQSAGEPGPHPHWLRCLGRDDSGNAVYGHLAVGQPIMLVGSPSELAAMLPRLTSELQSIGGEDYPIWADHGGAALMGLGRSGSGSTGEIVTHLAESRRGNRTGGCVVLAPASTEPLDRVRALAAVGRLHLIVASGSLLLDDCILMALSVARSGHRITITIPATDYRYDLSAVALPADTPRPAIAPLPHRRAAAAPLPAPDSAPPDAPRGDWDVEPGRSPIQSSGTEQCGLGTTDPGGGPDEGGHSRPGMTDRPNCRARASSILAMPKARPTTAATLRLVPVPSLRAMGREARLSPPTIIATVTRALPSRGEVSRVATTKTASSDRRRAVSGHPIRRMGTGTAGIKQPVGYSRDPDKESCSYRGTG